MAGEEIFTSNSILSIGTAFFFILIYLFYENKGIKTVLKPVFFIAAIAAIINGWQGQALAYKYQALYTQQGYIEGFWLTGLLWLFYFIILAMIIDLAFYTYRTFFKGSENG